MFELLEKIFLTGLGAVYLTQKKAEELADELREKYRLSEEEGRKFAERAQKLAREQRDRLTEMVNSEVRRTLDQIGLVRREEFERLVKRVEELEVEVRGVERE
jgi:polyhydroxyalkanoate synthesis regulator phasin